MATVYAHRGASREFPENTLAAFRRAVELGTPGIELDVHLTRDGVAVVMHDETVDRTTNGTGALAELDLSDLVTLDAGQGEKVPTLEQVIAVVAGKTHLNIEVKANAAASEVLRIAKSSPTLDWAISSFDWDVLRYAFAQDETIPLWPLGIGATEDILALAEEIRAPQLNLLDHAIDADIIAFLKERGLGTWVWTVNDPQRAKDLAAWGAIGICTDDPAVILEALGSLRETSVEGQRRRG